MKDVSKNPLDDPDSITDALEDAGVPRWAYGVAALGTIVTIAGIVLVAKR